MINDAQKVPLARTLSSWTHNKAQQAIDLLGQSLPASVVTVVSSGIVTVKFEISPSAGFTLPQITVPVFSSEYVRLPIQVGMKGAVMAFDAYLGGMTGLGGGTADLTPRPNLSNLCFAPLGSSSWGAVEDANALVLYGPDGAILRTADKASSVTISANGAAVKVPLGKTVTITTLPLSPAGLTSGALWNNGGAVNVVP
jgi:hypothetical protein